MVKLGGLASHRLPADLYVFVCFVYVRALPAVFFRRPDVAPVIRPPLAWGDGTHGNWFAAFPSYIRQDAGVTHAGQPVNLTAYPAGIGATTCPEPLNKRPDA
ncbi:hypothetical protein [Rhodopila sp.]|uniref:hypothetical protein n=1 Tax=Rhodopila sp. TaxID=2480087 RepID=UPI002D7F967C|nr:hypothetical protein [Rhodopila sp.]